MRDEYVVGLWKDMRKNFGTFNGRISFFVGKKRRVKF